MSIKKVSETQPESFEFSQDNLQEAENIIKKYPKLSPKFIFLYPAYNFRNNEVGGIIGLSQLKSLDKNNKKRKENFKFFTIIFIIFAKAFPTSLINKKSFFQSSIL